MFGLASGPLGLYAFEQTIESSDANNDSTDLVSLSVSGRHRQHNEFHLLGSQLH
jgi:hypothetical protein